MANRITQEVAEVLLQNPASNTHARLTQLTAEVLISLAPAKTNKGGAGKWFFRQVGETEMDDELFVE